MTFRKVLHLRDDRMFAPRSTPKTDDHAVRTSLTAYSIHSQPLSVSASRLLHPQHEDTLCREIERDREREYERKRESERDTNGYAEDLHDEENIVLIKLVDHAECMWR